MTKIILNDQEHEVPEGLTILQAARYVGVEIPVFCYHDRLSIAGNCRMCLVEVANSPKPVASCALPIAEGMVIKTQTDMVHKARKGVLEFLLINHPLDCPICDQGGECDLQDITVAYGPCSSRFSENKRAVGDKEMGPLIKTSMTRCIHCTRCVRFATDVAGVPELGAIGRGEEMEITGYLDQIIESELSGNVIDLCPVGALTSKPYAFQGRPWELQTTDSIDIMDAMGSAIRIDSHRMKVMRILPRLAEDINEEWLSDKSRFAYDGLLHQRLDRPYVRDLNGKLQPTTWNDAFATIAASLKIRKGSQLGAMAGPFVDVESTFALKEFLQSQGCTQFDCRPQGVHVDPSVRASYTFNSKIAGIDKADVCLIIGSSLRSDAPLMAARLRKRYMDGGLRVGYLGARIEKQRDLTHLYDDLGSDPGVLKSLLQGNHPFAQLLKNAEYPMIILGEDALKRSDGPQVLRAVHDLVASCNGVRSDWNGYNFLARSAGMTGALDVGFVSSGAAGLEAIYQAVESGAITWVYLHGADEVDFSRLKKAFKVYAGHHGDQGAHHADVILPGAAYTEKNATYVNLEGRAQRTLKAIDPPGDAKADWQIVVDLAAALNTPLPYNTLQALRDRMAQHHPVFAAIGQVLPNSWDVFGKPGSIDSAPFTTSNTSFYMTDVISRHSPTMAKCAQLIEQGGFADAV